MKFTKRTAAKFLTREIPPKHDDDGNVLDSWRWTRNKRKAARKVMRG